jgi:hypothetical protein
VPELASCLSNGVSARAACSLRAASKLPGRVGHGDRPAAVRDDLQHVAPSPKPNRAGGLEGGVDDDRVLREKRENRLGAAVRPPNRRSTRAHAHRTQHLVAVSLSSDGRPPRRSRHRAGWRRAPRSRLLSGWSRGRSRRHARSGLAARAGTHVRECHEQHDDQPASVPHALPLPARRLEDGAALRVWRTHSPQRGRQTFTIADLLPLRRQSPERQRIPEGERHG